MHRARASCGFQKYGIPVCIPWGDNERYDLIAEFDGKLNKIQVKSSQKIIEDKVKFSLVSSTMHRQNGVKHIYTENEIDYFALYNLERDKVCLVSINEEGLPKSEVTIRFNPPKTKNQFKTFLEEDYLIEKVLNR